MKKSFWLLVLLLGPLPPGTASAAKFALADDTAELLGEPVAEHNAVIWYLGHAAWAIKTSTHLLIFDYYVQSEPPAVPSLGNGFVNAEELRDLDVVVFVSHRDSDHYDPLIWQWRKSIPNIRYVLGWEPAIANEDYVRIRPHETTTVDNIEITAIPSTDSGSGFLIKADGLVFYHCGDNAFWKESYRPRYYREIEWLANKTDHTDFVFLNWRLDPDRETLEEGLWKTAEMLGARYIIPSHMRGREDQIVELIKDAPSEEQREQIVDKRVPGERILYRDGQFRP